MLQINDIMSCRLASTKLISVMCNRGHLDLFTTISAPPGHMDGILGQSLYVKAEDRLRDPSDKSFYADGQEMEFTVQSLFDALPLKQASSRRRRLIEGGINDELVFPLTASFQSRK